MRNILVSLKNLVHSKDENKPQCDSPPDNPQSGSSPLFSPLPHVESGRRLTGKVAGLPHAIRAQVNQWLCDGVTYKKICASPEQRGYPGFVHQYIQRWKDNGYKHWLHALEHREQAMLDSEAAEELVKDPKRAAHLVEANEMKLALRTSRLLDAADTWDAEATLVDKDKSQAFFNLSRSVTRQLSERTRRERFKADYDLKTAKQEISEEGKRKVFDLTAPLTPEQRTAILDKIDELLGIRLDPDGARVSPPAAMPEVALAPEPN